MIEKLSGEYIRGYTRAIMDVTEVFGYIQADLKHHHKTLNHKAAMQLLKTILENREALREDWEKRGFFRYVNGSFEWHKPERKKR